MAAIPEFETSTRPLARRRASGVPAIRNASPYDAGAVGTSRTRSWHAPTSSPNAAVLANLTTLRDRSRAAVRNNGYAKGTIDKLVANLIGSGIKPLSQAKDKQFRRALHALWTRWTDQSDADGLLDFYGQQAQVARGWLEGGESFPRLRLRLPNDGLAVPLQIQVLEPEQCPHTYDVPTLATGNRIRAGIEFNAIGRRVAYWMHPVRPGDPNDYDISVLRRVPAETVMPVYDPLRSGQLRGVPHLTPALIALNELAKFQDAVLLRQQIANLFAGFLKRPAGADQEGINPLSGVANEGSDVPPIVSMEPGTIQELQPGEELAWSEPPSVGQDFAAFMRQQLQTLAAATGVPYEVITGDMSGLNDRTMRVILNEFRRQLTAWQHQILAHQFCRRVWLAFLDRAIFSGALPGVSYAEFVANPDPWAAVKWMPPKWPYIHPVQDVQAQKEAIRCGFTTRSAVVSENGEDVEAIDDEQKADNERADALGLRYDSDGRQTSSASAAATERGQDDDEQRDDHRAQENAA